jgi:Dyp-type peroxidase family
VAHRIQEGLIFEPGTRPPPSYRLLLLNAQPPATADDVAAALRSVLSMLRDLAVGRVRDLAGQPDGTMEHSREQFAGLEVLLGYGRRFFDDSAHAPPLTRAARPDFLSYLARPTAFPAVPWADADTPNTGEADFALQLAGNSEAAVNCAAVECWKLIQDDDLALTVAATFAGFGRHDGRGWLDFHDGVSNIPSSQRLAAIEAAADPPWMRGGTYMAFLRLAVDLVAWRSVDRATQELVIGRDKLSGAALTAVERDESGRAAPVAASTAEQASWRDPPQTSDPLLEASHIHRANQNRASPAAPGGLRMFRQGYDFLDGFHGGLPVLGLNFVSFQSDLRTLQHVLNLPGWLGDANFGGPAQPQPGEPPSPHIAALLAGGFYALPPRAKPFPGSDLFSD